MSEVEIRFLPQNISVEAARGSSLLELAREACVEIESSCNGLGTCGKCLVRHVAGALEAPHPDESRLLSGESLAQGVRLACRVKANGSAAFAVVHGSASKEQILSQGFMPDFNLDPQIRKVYKELPIPGLEDCSDDLLRIERALGMRLEKTPLALLREIPGLLRTSGYKATFVLSGESLLGIEPGDTSRVHYGIAVDIGTTTVVVSLWDVASGLEIAAHSAVNPQKTYGLDVLSRIQHVRENACGLDNLRRAIIRGINSLIGDTCIEAGTERKNIYEVTIAANSTMMHLFLGVDPSGIGRSPYIPAFTQSQSFPATDLGINISRFGEVYCLPAVSGYVGADIVAGILCTELREKNERALFIDIGTNGEIVFSSGTGLFACSCAAGPALEGMNISCGMRAAEGAIESISIDDDVQVLTIGGKPARGICGSGIIDAVGEMLKAGVINKSGRYEKNRPGISEPLANRFKDEDGKTSFVLSFGEKGMPAVTLTQKDIRQVQLAKGAILSGILALMGSLNLKFSDIDRVYIAGAFGCHIQMENFARLGILPQELLDRVVLVGNTSKSGAVLSLLSKKKRIEASIIAGQVRYVELSCYMGFDRLFTQSLAFPEVHRS